MSWRRSSRPIAETNTLLTLAEIASRQNHQKIMKTTFEKIMIFEEANKRKLQDCGLRNFGEVFQKHPTRNIIDFESGRKTLEKVDFDDKQNRVRLMQRSGVPSKLPEDRLEFLLTVIFFVVLLLGLVGGVVASWRF
jgi:hypothetical protein